VHLCDAKNYLPGVCLVREICLLGRLGRLEGLGACFLCVQKNKFKICVRVCVLCLLCGDVCCIVLLLVYYLVVDRCRTVVVVCYVSPVRALAYNSVLILMCYVCVLSVISVIIVVFSVVVWLISI